MKELLRRPHLAGIGKGAEVPHQFCPVGRQGMEEVLKFFLDLRYASLHSGLSSFCPYSYAITGEHMQIDESVTSRVGAYGIEPPQQHRLEDAKHHRGETRTPETAGAIIALA